MKEKIMESDEWKNKDVGVHPDDMEGAPPIEDSDIAF